MSEYMWRVLVRQIDDLRKKRTVNKARERQTETIVDTRPTSDWSSGWSSGWSSSEDDTERDELLDEEGFEDYDDMEIVDIVLPYGK